MTIMPTLFNENGSNFLTVILNALLEENDEFKSQLKILARKYQHGTIFSFSLNREYNNENEETEKCLNNDEIIHYYCLLEKFISNFDFLIETRGVSIFKNGKANVCNDKTKHFFNFEEIKVSDEEVKEVGASFSSKMVQVITFVPKNDEDCFFSDVYLSDIKKDTTIEDRSRKNNNFRAVAAYNDIIGDARIHSLIHNDRDLINFFEQPEVFLNVFNLDLGIKESKELLELNYSY